MRKSARMSLSPAQRREENKLINKSWNYMNEREKGVYCGERTMRK